MDLRTLWFILITVLFTGFFFLEGFDYGVGMLLPFLGKRDEERRAIINTIGPFWDGNEVWMITAGGALFASFPQWYATLFSGFYIPLVLMLLALIFRGVGFEFRSKEEGEGWRSTWDWLIWIGSLLPALLWGVAIANIVRGVPIDANMHYTGGFFNLLNPYALVGGITFVVLFLMHGATYLALKLTNGLEKQAARIANRMWVATLVVAVIFLVYSYPEVLSKAQYLGISLVFLAIAVVALLVDGYFLKQGEMLKAFWAGGVTILGVTAGFFAALYPNVMPSSTDPAYSLTIYNASASLATLKVMTVVALVLVPIVLVYQAWTYYTFRQRISTKDEMTY